MSRDGVTTVEQAGARDKPAQSGHYLRKGSKMRKPVSYLNQFPMNRASKNPDRKIVIILDNFRSHRANATMEFAKAIEIKLVFLPPYSPHLNPIEYIWKSIKRIVSQTFIQDVEHLRRIIHEKFEEYSLRISFARKWIEEFLSEENKSKMLCS